MMLLIERICLFKSGAGFLFSADCDDGHWESNDSHRDLPHGWLLTGGHGAF